MSLRRLHFYRNFRTACYLIAYSAIALLIGVIVWVQAFGLPRSWCSRLEQALAERGIHATVERLRYKPFHGLQLDTLILYSDASHQSITAQLQQVVIDLDHLKAIQGEWRLSHIELLEAQLLLPTAVEEHPLRLAHLNGKLLITDHNQLEIVNASGEIEGIRVQLSAQIHYQTSTSRGREPSVSPPNKFKVLPAELMAELQRWRYGVAEPLLDLKLKLDVDDLSSTQMSFRFSCPQLSRNDLTMHQIKLEGHWQHSLLSITQLQWQDRSGQINATADYDTERREGSIQLQSSLDHATLLTFVPQFKIPGDLTLPKCSSIQLNGRYNLDDAHRLSYQAQGQLNASHLQWKSTRLGQISTEFSTNGHDLFLRNLNIEHDTGTLSGKILWRDGSLRAHAEGILPLTLIRDYAAQSTMAQAWEHFDLSGLKSIETELDCTIMPHESNSLQQLHASHIVIQHAKGQLMGELYLADRHVNYNLTSNLPADIWQPFFANQPLGGVLANFTERANAEHAVTLHGTQNLDDIYDWTATGHATIKNMSYRGVPVNQVSTDLDLDHHRLLFLNNRIDFNYDEYPLRQRFNGSNHGQVQATEVRYDCITGLLHLSAIHGSIYPAPLLRLFATSLADQLENYGFHFAPTLAGNGVVDIRHNQKTDLRIDIQQPVAMDWKFLGEMLTFDQLSGKVHVKSDEVTLQQLSFGCFDGNFQGDIAVQLRDQNPFALKLSFHDAKLQAIGETYHFDQHSFGDLDGSLDIQGNAVDSAALQGRGTCMMKRGQLFTVPLFGPLSSLLATLIDDKVAGIQSATDAHCDYVIRDGLLSFDDFQTNTSTLKFSGFGQIDLPKMKMDMTMKLNTRGLVGFLTLPLQPLFQGIFQFHGFGTLRRPTWEHVMFSDNPAARNDPYTGEKDTVKPQNN